MTDGRRNSRLPHRMSKHHLNGFLEDLKTINPAFRASTSSLKGLIQHLERTVNAPQKMTATQALQHCSKTTDNRLEKYAPAVGRLVSVWGKGGIVPYPMIRVGSSLSPVAMNRLCFRGDDRSPELIFAAGFTKRRKGAKPVYRDFTMKNNSLTGAKDPIRDPITGMARAGDLDPDTAVCVTPEIDVAALFPLPTSKERMMSQSYVYMVFVESGYNTNARQVLDALEGLSRLVDFEKSEVIGETPKETLHQVRIMDIQQNLYGRELATDILPAKSVCGAFRITRTWAKIKMTQEWVVDKFIKVPAGADYKDGGTYTILEWVPNPGAVYPAPSYETAARTFAEKMTEDIKGSKTFRLPTTTDGYSRSTGM